MWIHRLTQPQRVSVCAAPHHTSILPFSTVLILFRGHKGPEPFPGIHSPERSPQYVRNPITGTEDNKLLMHSPHRAYANSTSCTSKLMQWKIQHERSTSWVSPDCNTTSRERSSWLQHDSWTHTKALGCIVWPPSTILTLALGIQTFSYHVLTVTSDCKKSPLDNAGLSPVTASWGNSTAGVETAAGSVKPLTGILFFFF